VRRKIAISVLVLTLLAPDLALPATILSGPEVQQAVVGKTLAQITSRYSLYYATEPLGNRRVCLQ
jgi:hypothetical protein